MTINTAVTTEKGSDADEGTHLKVPASVPHIKPYHNNQLVRLRIQPNRTTQGHPLEPPPSGSAGSRQRPPGASPARAASTIADPWTSIKRHNRRHYDCQKSNYNPIKQRSSVSRFLTLLQHYLHTFPLCPSSLP